MEQEKQEGQVQSEEVTTQQPDAEEAAMQAAIAEARGHEPPASTQQEEQQEETKPEEQEPTATQEREQEPEPAKPLFAGMTEEELKAKLAKADRVDTLESQLRTVHGRFGELNSRLLELQRGKEGQQPAGGKDVTELSRQYNEALIDGDVEKAAELMVQMVSATSKPESNSSDVDQRLTEQQRRMEERLVFVRHPDFLTVIKTPDFGKWRESLSPEDRQAVETSEDGVYLAGRLDEFKAWRAEQAKNQQAHQDNQQQRNNRLERAITPSGSNGAPPPIVTEEDAMRATIRARLRPRATT